MPVTLEVNNTTRTFTQNGIMKAVFNAGNTAGLPYDLAGGNEQFVFLVSNQFELVDYDEFAIEIETDGLDAADATITAQATNNNPAVFDFGALSTIQDIAGNVALATIVDTANPDFTTISVVNFAGQIIGFLITVNSVTVGAIDTVTLVVKSRIEK